MVIIFIGALSSQWQGKLISLNIFLKEYENRIKIDSSICKKLSYKD